MKKVKWSCLVLGVLLVAAIAPADMLIYVGGGTSDASTECLMSYSYSSGSLSKAQGATGLGAVSDIDVGDINGDGTPDVAFGLSNAGNVGFFASGNLAGTAALLNSR